jgi:hypothetical protein
MLTYEHGYVSELKRRGVVGLLKTKLEKGTPRHGELAAA